MMVEESPARSAPLGGQNAGARLLTALWIAVPVILGRVSLQLFIDRTVEGLRGDHLWEHAVEHLMLATQQAWLLVVAAAVLPRGRQRWFRWVRGLVVSLLAARLLAGIPDGELPYRPGLESLRGLAGWGAIVVAALGIALLDRWINSSRRWYFRQNPMTLYAATACLVILAGASMKVVSLGVQARRIYLVREHTLASWDLVQRALARDTDLPDSVRAASLLPMHEEGAEEGSRPGLVIAPGGQALFEVVPRPDTRLRFDYAVDVDSVRAGEERSRAGPLEVVFAVRVDDQEVFRDTLDPVRNEDDRGWHSGEVDLSDRDGRPVELEFRVDGAWPEGLLVAGFGRPRLVQVDRVPRQEGSRERPNVVLVSLDSLRRDRVGAYGAPRRATPNLDRLARTAYRFDQAVAPSSHTWSSVASLVTGRYPLSHGVYAEDRSFLSDSLVTLPEWLQARGITTGGWTTNPMISERRNFHQGFEVWRDIAYGRGRLATREFRDFVKRYREYQFFAWVHFGDLRPPHQPTPEDLAPFTDDRDLDLNEDLLERAERLRQGDAGAALSDAELAHLKDLYDGELFAVDGELARLEAILREEGIWYRTILIVTAPHGEEFQEHGGLLAGTSLHAEQLDVPLILRLPGEDGRVIQDPVDLTRVMATVAALLGEEPPPMVSPALPPWGSSRDPRAYSQIAEPVAGAADEGAGLYLQCMVQDPDWKLVMDSADGVQLFDRSADPGERTDVHADHPEVVDLLRWHLSRWSRDSLQSAVVPIEDRLDWWTRRMTRR